MKILRKIKKWFWFVLKPAKIDVERIANIIEHYYMDPCINLTEDEEKKYKGMPSSKIVAQIIKQELEKCHPEKVATGMNQNETM